jgi:hypothetical protein
VGMMRFHDILSFPKQILEKIRSGPKWIQHLSDALRLAILYK